MLFPEIHLNMEHAHSLVMKQKTASKGKLNKETYRDLILFNLWSDNSDQTKCLTKVKAPLFLQKNNNDNNNSKDGKKN